MHKIRPHPNYHLLRNDLFKRLVSWGFYFNIDIIRFLLKESFLLGVKAKNTGICPYCFYPLTTVHRACQRNILNSGAIFHLPLRVVNE